MGLKSNGLGRLDKQSSLNYRRNRRRRLLKKSSPIMALMRLIQSSRSVLRSSPPSSILSLPRFYSKPAPYAVKVGIPEFLSGIGGGVETHIAKLETEIGDLPKLLVTRTLRLKKFGIPCKHRKLILKYNHKYRLGLWKPRADAIKA